MTRIVTTLCAVLMFAVAMPSNAQKHSEMVDIPAGEFIMGCDKSDKPYCMTVAQPAHKVYLDSYKVDKYPVTFDRYQKCIDAGKCTEPFWGGACNYQMSWSGDHPVNCVDYGQAEAFCHYDGKRLLTEAEWEKAARGTDARPYPWGDAQPSCDNVVMSQKTAGSKMGPGCGAGTTKPVGSKPKGASPYGALDMAGNLWEWTSDWYSESYFKNSPKNNPKGPKSGTFKTLRGSSWLMRTHEGITVTNRTAYSPIGQGYVVGFRCAASTK